LGRRLIHPSARKGRSLGLEVPAALGLHISRLSVIASAVERRIRNSL
jgi:hypothetical protein